MSDGQCPFGIEKMVSVAYRTPFGSIHTTLEQAIQATESEAIIEYVDSRAFTCSVNHIREVVSLLLREYTITRKSEVPSEC